MKRINWIITFSILITIILNNNAAFAIFGWNKDEPCNNSWKVPRQINAPEIDGVIDPAEWASAAAVTGFIGVGASHPTASQPTAFLCYDNEAFYVAVRIPCPKGVPLVSNVKERDGRLWSDDSIDLLISSSDKVYRHFMVNAANTRYDAIGKTNSGWNGNWLSATGREADFWTLEVAIPWKDLGYTSPPQSLNFNIGWNCKTGLEGSYSWSAVDSSYHETNRFVKLILSRDKTALRLTNLSLLPDQSPCLKFELVGNAKEPVKASLSSLNGKVVTTCQSQKGESELIVTPPKEGDAAKSGDYILEYQCGDLANWKMGIQISSPMISVKRMLAGFVDVSVDLSLMGADAEPVKIDLALISNETKQTVMKTQLDAIGKSQLVHAFDINAVPVGRYTVEAAVLDKSGQKIATYYDTTINKPTKPEWQGYQGGVSDAVLPPWTPIEVAEGNQVQVWGREYRMGNGIFPDSIITQEREILSAPITFKGACNGVPFELENQSGKLVKHSPDKVSFEGSMSGGNIQIKGTSVIEYDGMLKVDFDVIPSGNQSSVDLVLEIPLKQENAKYLFWFPGIWGEATNAKAVPSEGWSGPFKPYFWLGDDDCGLGWFCEGAEGWRPADPDRALSVIRRGDDVVLRLDILNNVSLDKPRHYTFGLEATPVKPVTGDAWDYRILRIGSYGLDKDKKFSKRANAVWWGKGNINLEKGTLECWVRPDFNPNVIIKDENGKPENQRLLFMNFGPKQYAGINWDAVKKNMSAYLYTKEGKPIQITFSGNQFKKGQWHHVAISWGKEFAFWIDGKKAGAGKYNGLPRIKIDEVNFGFMHGKFAVDEFRISDIVRVPQSFNVPFQKDSHTLLLETFNKINGNSSGGTIRQYLDATPGKFDKAVLLYIPGDPSYIDHLASLGVRTIVFHQSWTGIQNSHIPHNPQELKDLVKACHKNNMQILLYWGFQMSEIHPGWEFYNSECLQVCSDDHPIPNRQLLYNRPDPAQRCWQVCYGSSWADYVAWSAAKLMDEYDIDGVYLDGTTYPFPCSNEYHGCGYVGEDGKRHDVTPIFAIRKLMKRLYAIVKTRKPDGQVNSHNSMTSLLVPTIGWATSVWDGEQLAGTPRVHFSDVLPLDTFRAEFTGRQSGVPNEFLAYNRRDPYTPREALAFTLLHDIIVRLDSDPYLANQLWNVMDSFGRKQAQWLGYWDNSRYVITTADDVKVSLYNRKEKGVLMIVSNLARTEQSVTVVPNAENLEIGAGPFTATDMITNEPVKASADGKISLHMKYMEWRLIKLESKK